MTAELTTIHRTAEDVLRELWEAVQAPLDWQNNTDATFDFAEADPEGFERIGNAMEMARVFLDNSTKPT